MVQAGFLSILFDVLRWIPLRDLDQTTPEGESLKSTKTEETRTVCHTILQDPSLYSFLLCIDQDLAAAARALGCTCGGVLHAAPYPRKPRGAAVVLDEDYWWRWSFCCADCRHRMTPESVRFLGRRVYLGVVVVLLSAMCAGITDRRASQLAQSFGVPRRTLERWREWWLNGFAHSAFWTVAQARFMPAVARLALPANLLERFVGETLRARLLLLLQFLRPLSTRATSTLVEGV